MVLRGGPEEMMLWIWHFSKLVFVQWVRVDVDILILLSCKTLIGRGLLGCGHVGDSAGWSSGAECGVKQNQVL